ncbi:CCA tRNA nucleotidyltransferase [Acetobacter sp.]|jgi:poly(A) polymerase|uniref:CCA tRNA nucleotidyltransferase n=1 Tax=Acetobacter sp. TaxID=440 RepID=UPI0025BDB597|nr:CCA tRNA nucleotidyltransferase [Acetobacter sp.]MCH4090664.1 CCA tRNA nucleotidyltransferase [Acetobacter sp.]MCI1300107.1 CCA tRNA nucleotidyltransferase [Acetobacter sp.]MCI1316525.1 CCA tRNA nucleotidyltransferase [Acetobacter sp.]
MVKVVSLPLEALPDFPALCQIWEVLPQARLVGGAVRDMLNGMVASDFDFGTPETPQEVMKRLRDAGISAVPTGLSHGTVTAVIDHRGYEITTLRRDDVTDGRHADVSWTQNWEEDAARRDFTINAMSCDRTGHIHDYFDGQADLKAGRVRFVGEAETRIREDALRILRFFRFQARFGAGVPDQVTLTALRHGVALIERLSVERIWSELRRILTGPRVTQTLCLMKETGALTACLPELTDCLSDAIQHLDALISSGGPADYALRLAVLLAGAAVDSETAKRCVERLRLSRADSSRVLAFLQKPFPMPERVVTEEDVICVLAEIPREVALGQVWLAEAQQVLADRACHEAAPWKRLRFQLESLPVPVFPLAGRDLLAEGIPPGPRVGELLSMIRSWWLQSGCRAGREECLTCLRRLHKSFS